MHSNVYVSSNQVRIKISTNAAKIYISSNHIYFQEETQPYALKGDQTAMSLVKPVQILVGNDTLPACDVFHDVPAIVFSSGGFVGNIFHELNDIIIPLFVTSHRFRADVRFVVTDYQFWFIYKYKKVFSKLSRYEVIDVPSSNGSFVHCFPGAVVGLKYHGNLALNASDIPRGYSMSKFRQFLRESYGFKKSHVSQIEKPALLLISRKERRIIINQDEVINMIQELGFRVVKTTPNEMLDLDKFAHLVNWCSVLVGVHGAGLTNELFLPNGAVVVQVIPLGLDWAANAYYGEPARAMGLQYLEYKIEAEESSLYYMYGPEDPIVTDPESIGAKGYRAFREIYLDKQNVQINVARFRKTLVEAMRLTGH